MSRFSPHAALASDVVIKSSRNRILWVYLFLSTVLVSLTVAFTEIAPPANGAPGFALRIFSIPITQSGLQEEVARPAMVGAMFRVMLVEGMAGFFGVFLGLLAMVNSVGSAFEPGTAELILPRPLSRAGVVVSRFAGALGFGLIQVGWLCLLGVVLSGFKFGVWEFGLLLLPFVLLLKFAVVLAVCTLGVVFSRTRTLGLALAVFAWAASYLINLMRHKVEDDKELQEISAQVVWAHHLLPEVSQINEIAGVVCGQPSEVPWYDGNLTVLRGLIWVAVPLALTLLVVSRRDH